jgi:hypothetical protein
MWTIKDKWTKPTNHFQQIYIFFGCEDPFFALCLSRLGALRDLSVREIIKILWKRWNKFNAGVDFTFLHDDNT